MTTKELIRCEFDPYGMRAAVNGPWVMYEEVEQTILALTARVEVNDAMAERAILEFHRPSKGLGRETLITKARRVLTAALNAKDVTP